MRTAHRVRNCRHATNSESENEKLFLRLYNAGLNDEQIANAIGLSPNAIASRRKVRQMASNYWGSWALLNPKTGELLPKTYAQDLIAEVQDICALSV